jgi:hypothetical protein
MLETITCETLDCILIGIAIICAIGGTIAAKQINTYFDKQEKNNAR